MPDSIVVWGAGGHGRVVADVATAAGYRVTGFIDADPDKVGKPVGSTGLRVLSGEEQFLAEVGSSAVAVALGLGDNQARINACNRLPANRLPTLVHPSAVVSASARLGPGTVVMPMVTVNADAVLGAAVILNTACVVEHDCVVGAGAHVSPGAVLAGAARLGRLAWLGANATVIPRCSVGDGAIIGAGAVVLEDVPGQGVYVGVPARSIVAAR